jgi:hypothetical protein
MRYLFGFLCVCALGLMPLVGCSETAGDGGSGGTAGDGGSGGSNSAVFPCTEQGILDAIAEGGGPHTFDCNGQTTVTTNAEIVIDNDVILDGEGNLTVDGDEGHPVFQVGNVTAELHGFTVTGGVSDSGGGILTFGTLTLTNSTVSGNMSTRTGGSGIFNGGTLTLTNSTVSANRGQAVGDGISNGGGGTLTLTNSTVSGNDGYGINLSGTLTLTLTNSTVSGNTEGGIKSGNNVRTVTLTNSLIDGECAFQDISVLVSNGYNIESPGDTCGFDQGTDQINVTEGQLNLGSLRDNGGPTMTHELGAGSVAIDDIPAVDCEVETDQRGVERPQGDACDVGAFESARAAALASYCAAVLECFPGDESCEADFANLLWVGSGGDLAACTSAKSELVECAAALDCDKLGEEVLDAVIHECSVQLGAAWQACEVPVK